MPLKIKTPRPGEVVMAKELDGELYVPASTIAARDAQWLALVGPVVQALRDAASQARHPDYDWPMWLSKDVEAALRAITEEQE